MLVSYSLSLHTLVLDFQKIMKMWFPFQVKEVKSTATDASNDKKSSSPMVKREKKGWLITEDAMERKNRKNPQYIFVMNMIISFIILVAVIGNIICVLQRVKT